MTVTDTTVRSQSDAITSEFDLHHSPAKVWRAITDPVLLAEWLLPVIEGELGPGAASKPEQKLFFARYRWKMMGGKLVDLLGRMS